MSGIAAFVIIILAVSLYLAPTIVALVRHIPNKWSVVVINVLLGWTFIGWVVALAMAARDTNPSGVAT